MRKPSGFVERTETHYLWGSSKIKPKDGQPSPIAVDESFNFLNIFKIVKLTWIDFYTVRHRKQCRQVTDFLQFDRMKKLYSRGYHIKIIFKNAYTGEALGDLDIPTYDSLLLTKYKEYDGAIPIVLVFEGEDLICELFDFKI